MTANSPTATMAAVVLPQENVANRKRFRSSKAERRTFSR